MNRLLDLEPILTQIPALSPLDAHNRTLMSNVHPPQWVNPEPASRYNLVAIGAGTAGLVTVAGAGSEIRVESADYTDSHTDRGQLPSRRAHGNGFES